MSTTSTALATAAETAAAPAPVPLLDVQGLRVVFGGRRRLFARPAPQLIAVNGIDLMIGRGETFGLVGESGCGKSTLGRAVLQLVRPTAGRVAFDGVDLVGLDERALRAHRRRMQMVFQDPFSSLNPRMTAGDTVAEPIEVHGLERPQDVPDAVRELFRLVGLDPDAVHRFPHEFSGGQRQRLGIARALAARPDFIVCDEPVSSLDVSIQAQIVNLLEDLRGRLKLAYLFIAHDLAVVRHLSDRIGVMYLGRIVELAGKRALYEAPLHPYTRMLLAAVPSTDRKLERTRAPAMVLGEVPSPLNPPTGCHFHPRCPQASTRCRSEAPVLRAQPGNQWVACHLYD